MPKRNDFKNILIIGAGPIVIGQACEFDYSGAQACKALKQEGYRVILINSNPATIMTDPNMADATYVEPITVEAIEQIIKKENIDALLPTMGGQTALNVAMDLAKAGILEKYKVKMIGARPEVIEKAEDRQMFRDAMDKIGLESPKSAVCRSLADAEQALITVGLPAIIRPSFTLGGLGGGVAHNTEEFTKIVLSGLASSPISEVLVEESVIGWKEMEMEVVRDAKDNCIIVCSIENLDPMGIHTGDSITVAPALTLTDPEYQKMRDAAIAVLREIGVDTGGSNVQFAINPDDGRMVVIEMNPRVSRSSALASKATGFPIAAVAAKLAVGYTLDEIMNDITGSTPASFEPSIDYVVVKIPRFTFEKFPDAEPILGTSMKSIGEAMAIGRSFQEAFQKALRSMEIGFSGLNEPKLEGLEEEKKDKVLYELAYSRPNRVIYVAEAFRLGIDLEEIYRRTKIDRWFLRQIAQIVEKEKLIRKNGIPEKKEELFEYKMAGFSDARLAELSGNSERKIRTLRTKLDIHPVFKRIDTCAAELNANTAYMYSTYEYAPAQNEAEISDRKKVIIFGGGPNRIGQGIEFDYCCCHAAFALKESNVEAIMVNCNPETVSTDYDTSDRLYFEPLTAEDTLEIIRMEAQKGKLLGVIVQLGGQTPLKLSQVLEEENIPILGTSPDSIDLAEDRERFKDFLNRIGALQPESGIAHDREKALKIANQLGYPVLLRPSYVLGGRAMKIVFDDYSLNQYIDEVVKVTGQNPILVDKFLSGADEVDVDVLCDGNNVYIAGVMQQIEEAGIHSGDSSCSLPPFSLPKRIVEKMKNQAKQIAIGLKVRGLMNVQFAVHQGEVYIIEVNPRASRTVPFVAKATGVEVAKIATKIMLGENLKQFNLPNNDNLNYIAVKKVVFPFSRFPGSDTVLGPEMKSTGEVMGIDKDFGLAFAKAQIGTGFELPLDGEVFVTVKNEDKPDILPICRQLFNLGFSICSTSGTAKFLQEHGLTKVRRINRVSEGRPNCVDELISGKIKLVLITSDNKSREQTDGYLIRQNALLRNIPHYTTVSSMRAFVSAIESLTQEELKVKPLQEYYQMRKKA